MIYEWLDITAAVTTAAFVNGVWIGALLAVAAWGLIRLMAEWHPLNATTRFFVWMTVFVMSIGLVIWQGERYIDDRYAEAVDAVEAELPAGLSAALMDEVEIPDTPEAPSSPVKPEVPAEIEVPVAFEVPAEIEVPVQLGQPSLPITSQDFEEEEAAAPALPAAMDEVSEQEASIIASGLLSRTPRFSFPDQIEMPVLNAFWRVVLFTIWATIAGMLLLRVVLGWRGVWRLKRNSYPAPVRVQTLLKKLLGQIENPRPIEVAISDDVQTAVAIGFQKPKILLPASMLSTLSSGELEQVLLHEAAHLQRRDDWTMLFQRIVSAFLFFHPGIILLGKLMDRDREFASDDWVIALTKRPKAYASCLAKLVTQYARTQPPMFVPGFSSGKKELFARVKTILDKKREISFKLSPATYLSVLMITILLLVFVVQIAPVVALPQQADDASLAFLPEVEVIPAVVETPDEVLAVDTGIVSELDDLELPEEADLSEPALASLPKVENADVQVDNNNVTESNDATTLESVSALRYEALFNGEADVNALPQAIVPQAIALQPEIAQPEITLPEIKQPATITSDAPVRNRRDSLSAKSFARVLKNASRISSSGDRTSLLLEAVQKRKFEYATTAAYLATTSTVPSSGDKARLLMALTKHQQLDSLSAKMYLREVSGISSSSDKSRVLINSLNNDGLPLNSEATRSEYIRVIESISSSSDYRKVMKVFLEKSRRVKG